MSASLVGSEMCIRDSTSACARACVTDGQRVQVPASCPFCVDPVGLWRSAVSYTHLTLPTICSV
eukprot:1147273-Alexandrium_andersonii.AAC.1